MTVVVYGDRRWKDKKAIREIFSYLPSGSKIIRALYIKTMPLELIVGKVISEFHFIDVTTDEGYYAKDKIRAISRKITELGEKPDFAFIFHDNIHSTVDTLYFWDKVGTKIKYDIINVRHMKGGSVVHDYVNFRKPRAYF